MDSSNHSLSFFRNRLRGELLPLLLKYNPGFHRSLLQLARIASDDYAFVEGQALSKWPEIAQEEKGRVYFDLRKLLNLPLSLRRTVFYLALEHLRGSPRGIEAKHIEQMLSTLSKPAGTRISLPGNITFYKEYERCLLALPGEVLCPFPSLGSREFPLHIPGTTLLPGWRVEAIAVSGRPEGEGSRFTAYLDLQAMGRCLVVRGRRRGDVFQPLGMGQPKKLQDFMVDAKIPRLWRDCIPLVCSAERILWVVGYRIAEGTRLKEKSTQVLHIEFLRADSGSGPD
jgi:tRNA(Ile)-lysidine synthase